MKSCLTDAQYLPKVRNMSAKTFGIVTSSSCADALLEILAARGVNA
jgi:hypothetical protein